LLYIEYPWFPVTCFETVFVSGWVKPTSYPGHFASGQRKWPWHRPVTWPQNLQYLGCSIMIIYAYKYVYRIIIYIVITDRSKHTQCCVYSQRERACSKRRNAGTPECRNTGMPEHRNAGTPEYHFHFEGKF
jgi:hypothetical protein